MTDQELLIQWWKNKEVKKLCKAFFNINLTSKQENLVSLIAYSEHKRATICCMTRYGKSFCVSMGIILWLIRNHDKKIVLIAPTREKTMIIRNYIAGFLTWNPVLAELLDIDKKGIERIRKEVSKNRMTFKRNNELRTLTAEGQGQALMGWGSDLCLVDEICDIDYEVYRSKITRMLGDNPESVYIEIGNPNHRDGQMWQHWTNPNWHHVHIDYTIALSEKRISQDFIDEQKSILTDREFGILYRAEFPEESEDQLIHWSWIQEAIKSEKKLIGEVVAGADIAEKGNDTTVLTIGIKDKLTGEYETTKIMHWDQAETMTTVGRIAEAIKEMGIKRIRVDSSGIGAGVYSRLQELRSEKVINCIVKDYRGGKSPSNKASQARYLNQKAEAYFNLRELFEKKKIKIIKENMLIDQLTKMKWELTSSMKIKILDPGTSAEDTAEEKSPDYSDSLCYMCWEGGTPSMVIMGGEMFWKKPDASDAADVVSQSKMVSSGSLAGSSLN